jgi:cation diffusion facilitator family transporter
MDSRAREIYKVTLIGSVVNAVLIVVKLIAGIVGRSGALVADAVHSLSDFITDIIVLVFVKISSKPVDKGHDYGHGKYETFAAMIIGALLMVVGFGLMFDGIRVVVRACHGEILGHPKPIAAVAAALSIAAKEWLYHYTKAKGHKVNSAAVIANAGHHRSDALSSIGTLVGVGGAIMLGGGWWVLDPIAAIIVSLFIVKSGYTIVKPAVDELLESSLPEDEEKEILALALSIDGIEAVHRLRTRRIGNTVAIDFHAKMDGNLTLTVAHDIATEAERAIRRRFGGRAIVNIHMESIVKQ